MLSTTSRDLSTPFRLIAPRTGYSPTAWVRSDNLGCNTASELASLLGVNPAAGSQRLEYAMVPANTSYTFSGGYGLLVISNHSSGTTALYTVRHQVTPVEKVSGEDQPVTFSKPNEYSLKLDVGGKNLHIFMIKL